MATVTARIKVKGKHYEIEVNLDGALKIKQGKVQQGDIISALVSPHIFYDVRKGTKASNADLIDAFGTTDAYQVAQQIIQKGEVQKNQEFRDAEREAKVNQVVQLIVRNAVDQNGRPYTEERIKRALEEAHVVIDNRPADQQVLSIVEKIKTIIPIKLETKRIKIIIPAQYTGQIYGLLKDYKESEEWLANGSLSSILNVPAGMIIDFYDKLNNISHGTIQSEELDKK